MARKAPKISIDDLKIKIGEAACKAAAEELEPEEMADPFESAYSYLWYENQQIRDDLNKINFDFENYSSPNSLEDPPEIMGWHTLDNGFSFLGMWAGGDWETPVYFILYWDGKKVRGYVPETGNTFNPKYRTAFGSEGESPKYTSDKDFDAYMTATYGADYEDVVQDIEPNVTEYIASIVGRIEVS